MLHRKARRQVVLAPAVMRVHVMRVHVSVRRMEFETLMTLLTAIRGMMSGKLDRAERHQVVLAPAAQHTACHDSQVTAASTGQLWRNA